MTDSYVVCNPHSNTNPTDRFVVVTMTEWIDAINCGGTVPTDKLHTETREAAELVRDAMNMHVRGKL